MATSLRWVSGFTLFSIEYCESFNIDNKLWKEKLIETEKLPEDILNYLKQESNIENAEKKAQLFVLPRLSALKEKLVRS